MSNNGPPGGRVEVLKYFSDVIIYLGFQTSGATLGQEGVFALRLAAVPLPLLLFVLLLLLLLVHARLLPHALVCLLQLLPFVVQTLDALKSQKKKNILK